MIPRMTAEGELGWGSCHVWGWVVGLVASVSDSQKVCKGTKFSHTGPWVKAPSHQFFANFSNRIETGVGIESERREKERKGEREKRSWSEKDDDRLGTSGGCDSAVRTVDARAAVSDPGERESGGVREHEHKRPLHSGSRRYLLCSGYHFRHRCQRSHLLRLRIVKNHLIQYVYM